MEKESILKKLLFWFEFRTFIPRLTSPPIHKVKEVPENERGMKEAPLKEEIGFPAKVVGSIFHVGDDVTAVVGDIEIPSRITVNEILVVKGRLKVGASCRILRNVKAMKDIEIGANTIVGGNLISGERVVLQKGVTVKGKINAHKGLSAGMRTILKSSIIVEGDAEIHGSSKILGNMLIRGGRTVIGPNSIIYGSIESDGAIKIDENSVIKGSVYSKSSVTLHKSVRVCQRVNAENGAFIRAYVKRRGNHG